MFLKKLFKKKINFEETIKLGVISGLLEVIYIALVAGFFILAESLFPSDSQSAIMGIISMLMLFVFSAGVSAVLIFGIPFHFMLQKRYKEAGIVLVSSALSMIAVFVLIVLGEIFIY